MFLVKVTRESPQPRVTDFVNNRSAFSAGRLFYMLRFGVADFSLRLKFDGSVDKVTKKC